MEGNTMAQIDKKLNIISTLEVLPSSYADQIGVQYASSISSLSKKNNGQFFTPPAVAKLMASFSQTKTRRVKILDPGCGTCILSCALIEHMVHTNPSLEFIHIEAYETDITLIEHTQKVLNYLKQWLYSRNIQFQFELMSKDFILENADALSSHEGSTKGTFDIVMGNPPYFKLSKDDLRAKAAKSVTNGHPNIYSIFMALSALLLKNGGELVFITPRSFASGNYFKVFRQFFFKMMQLKRAHLFVSRKDTFDRDAILQETVILHARKQVDAGIDEEVCISTSHGSKDIALSNKRYLPLSTVLDSDSEEQILFLPINDKEEAILDIFKSWTGTLKAYDIQISTGPVVAFRAVQHIVNEYQNGSVFLAPLIWLHNVNKMNLQWPLARPNKGQYIRITTDTKSILIPNKNYILLRRFSSKDDKSRLIATPYFCNTYQADFIGVENKVNYIYRPHGHLDRNEVVGLSALLNSSLFDTYFRIFNGNVNVSATELRAITFPPLEHIQGIGNEIILSNDFTMEYAEKVINKQFDLSRLLVGQQTV